MSEGTESILAKNAGFDLDLIETNLLLSPEQRMKAHQSALDLVWALESLKNTVTNEEPQ